MTFWLAPAAVTAGWKRATAKAVSPDASVWAAAVLP